MMHGLNTTILQLQPSECLAIEPMSYEYEHEHEHKHIWHLMVVHRDINLVLTSPFQPGELLLVYHQVCTFFAVHPPVSCHHQEDT